MNLQTIGWQEWISLPNLDIGPIKAKIDTGARTSALHAFDISIQGDVVHFKVHTIQGNNDFAVNASASLVEERLVRDSGGKQTLRPVIRTQMSMVGVESEIELTLIDRQDMAFRMLIGRTALSGTFLVDCASSCVGGVPSAVKSWKQ